MRRVRYICIAFSIFLLEFQGIPSFAGPWSPPPKVCGWKDINSPGDDRVCWTISPQTSLTSGSVLRQQTKSPSANSMGEWSNCTQPGVAPCNQKDGNYFAVITLPHCESITQEWCIEGLTVSPQGPEKVVGQFLRNVEGYKTDAFPSLGFPAGTTPGLWKVRDVVHSGNTDTYVAIVNVQFGASTLHDSTLTHNEPRIHKLEARIIPYKQISRNTMINPSPNECAWTEALNTICGEVHDFKSNFKASLTIRVSNKVTGWLMGRLADPVVTVAPVSLSHNRLTIEARPIEVPLFFVSVDNSKLTDAMKKTFVTAGVKGYHLEKPFGIYQGTETSDYSPDVITAFKDAANDRAVASSVVWSFQSTEFGSGSYCLKSTDKLMGIVTTNSIAYEGTAPRFVDGFLDYKVAGVHFNPDGSVFEGRYDLVMLKSIAQCLYGFSDAPISATISILRDGAEQRISTSSLKEFGEGAFTWLKLSAQGFTFSNPTLRVKLSQASDSSSTPEKVTQVLETPEVKENAKTEPKPKPEKIEKAPKNQSSVEVKSSAKQLKKSIICVKGKITKKVTGSKPKCPTGFKKQ